MTYTAYTNKTVPLAISHVYQDEITEWRLLSALLNPKNVQFIHKLTAFLFTEDRVRVFYALQKAFSDYGTIEIEGISMALRGEIPGELLATQGANIRSAFDECARLAKKREALKKAEEFTRIAEQFDPDESDILNTLAFNSPTASEDSSLTSGAVKFLGDLHAKRSGDYQYAKTGYKWLDTRMQGEWKPGSLVVLAAPPGGGKTTLVGNSMYRMSTHMNTKTGELSPIPSLFFSLEMNKSDLFSKWAADILAVNSTTIANSVDLSETDLTRLEDLTAQLQTMPMFVIDNGKISLPKMVQEIREHVVQHSVRVVFLDYIQIVNHTPTRNKNSDLGQVADTLKKLANELGITVVVLSQLNRSGEGLDAIRDSGEIGQVADVVIALKPEDDTGDFKNITVEWLKNRLGRTGKTSVLFNGAFQRFEGGVVEVA